jgi:hypothetical protein
MLSKQEEEQERRETLENDLRVLRERGSTFHQHAQSQASDLAQGRFAATGAPRVVGSTPDASAQYPAAAPSHQVTLPPEQPLGYSVDYMPGLENPTGVSVSPPVATGAPAGAVAAAEHLPFVLLSLTTPEHLFPRTRTMAERPTVAQAIFPHLPSTDPRVVREQRRVDDWREQQRQSLLNSLREVNRKIAARLKREASKQF